MTEFEINDVVDSLIKSLEGMRNSGKKIDVEVKLLNDSPIFGSDGVPIGYKWGGKQYIITIDESGQYEE